MAAFAAKHLMRCLTKVHHDLGYFGRHLLSCTYVKRNAVPTPVVDTDFHGNICFGTGVRSNILLFAVSRFRGRCSVLPADDMFFQIFPGQRREGFVHFHHFITEVVGIEHSRRFHCSERHQLDQMILHHIPQSSGSFIESSTLLDTQVFYCGNLYIVDIITVPKRFKDAVSKAESKNILRRFFAQEVVYTVNLLFFEHRRIYAVQFAGRFQIIAKGFLHNDTRVGTIQMGSLEVKGKHTVQRRRCSQIIQHAIRLLLTRQFLKAYIQFPIIGCIGGIKGKIV